ncbi:SEL1-like repeat protein [Hydrogenophaga sp. 2FB]|uniref:SEL1-like repeat protein n=1 Tax=Hydrogenophaga sp. 2FB TaxID=2502187 RepID=UPI0010F6AB9F|nr:SEL1-like repeat protein [Hydrogenophaga sp. 2FB]
MNTEIPMTHPRTLLGAALALLSSVGEARDNGRGDGLRDPAAGHYRAHAEFKMGRYAQAREVWEALARAGDGEALFNLGTLAEQGLGEPRNPAKAEALYSRAARAR